MGFVLARALSIRPILSIKLPGHSEPIAGETGATVAEHINVTNRELQDPGEFVAPDNIKRLYQHIQAEHPNAGYALKVGEEEVGSAPYLLRFSRKM